MNVVMSVFFLLFSMIFYANCQLCGVKLTNNYVLSLSRVLVIPRKIKFTVFRAWPIFSENFQEAVCRNQRRKVISISCTKLHKATSIEDYHTWQ